MDVRERIRARWIFGNGIFGNGIYGNGNGILENG